MLTAAERALIQTDAELLRRRIANLNRFLKSDRLGPAAHEMARTQRDELAGELQMIEDNLRLEAQPSPSIGVLYGFGSLHRYLKRTEAL